MMTMMIMMISVDDGNADFNNNDSNIIIPML